VYQLRQPDAALRPFIERYWFVTPGPAPVDIRVDVYVDARADLVFSYGAPWRRHVLGGGTTEHGAACLDAQRLDPIRISQQGQVHLVGVRFHLGGLGAFAVGPLRPWTGQTPPPQSVLGPEIPALDVALAAAGPDQAAALLDAFFLARLPLARQPPARTWGSFRTALDLLVDSGGRAEVEAVARAAGVSVRQVERLFAQHLGLPPKVTGRVLRFQEGLRALMRDPGCPLSEVAQRAGYFDQAHFVRDFRRMTGGVPRGYRGYYPPQGPADFAPNVVAFVQAPG
jgi:AraC-like DNA-binding protein